MEYENFKKNRVRAFGRSVRYDYTKNGLQVMLSSDRDYDHMIRVRDRINLADVTRSLLQRRNEVGELRLIGSAVDGFVNTGRRNYNDIDLLVVTKGNFSESEIYRSLEGAALRSPNGGTVRFDGGQDFNAKLDFSPEGRVRSAYAQALGVSKRDTVMLTPQDRFLGVLTCAPIHLSFVSNTSLSII